jgi:hypothetical protein
MKNFKSFREFHTESEVNEYYSDYSYYGKSRKTKLAQKLDDIRQNLKRGSRYDSFSYGGDKDIPDVLKSPGRLFRSLVSGLFRGAAEVVDLFAPGSSGKSKVEKMAKSKKVTSDDVVDLWKEDLSSKTTEKDLVDFVKRSEGIALKRYGKKWDYKNPVGEDQKKFADLIKRGEEEIIKRF